MSSTQKRREQEGKSLDQNKKSRMVCSFKEKCYRKNPHHFREYDHPHCEFLTFLDALLEQNEDNVQIPGNYLDKTVVLDQLKIMRELNKPDEVWQDFHSELSTSCKGPMTFAEKLEKNAPYNIFFTVVPDSVETKNQHNAIKITDLLCPSLGILRNSLQINFMIDIIWLMEQYHATGNEKKPLTILYGEDFPNMKEYMAKNLPNVTPHFVKMKDPFGTHHSKIGLYYYADHSLRIHVSTANLYTEDWTIYCQGVWVSPRIPPLASDSPDSDGVGPTGFKTALEQYLRHYQIPSLNYWIKKIKRADFSDIKVFLVTSVPGKHLSLSTGSHLHRVGDLLSRHCELPDKDKAAKEDGPLSWHVIAQASSIGNLGATPAAWLRSGMLRSLASHKKHKLPANSDVKFSLIFPSVNNVQNSYKGEQGGGCLPYSRLTHEKQNWLNGYLHQWKADNTNRTRAMPHIKSYCRVSPCNTKLAWYLLTSANISKAAWGSLNKDTSSYIRSYEVGVLFLPPFFDEKYFTIKKNDSKKENKLFPFMYDLPLTPYSSSDKPWTM